MIILGIDPGIAIVGYGVIEYDGRHFRTLGMGAIRTPAGQDVEARIETVYNDMLENGDSRRRGARCDTARRTQTQCGDKRIHSASGEAVGRRLRQGGEAAGHGDDGEYSRAGPNKARRHRRRARACRLPCALRHIAHTGFLQRKENATYLKYIL